METDKIKLLKSLKTAIKKQKDDAPVTIWEKGYNEGIDTCLNIISDKIIKLKRAQPK